ncbi:16S rRNA (cytidine(1402)-2'-O)-methyltransferase [Candidatus Roizmanbacteria bacterium]|nr:16S rRNA (cytidine(1402)-2'-O)-methyltransferase [Candidatus Roizmanbacteria bacterium]
MDTGILYIVATPIGNREDITVRALKTLFSADVIACEDTRRTGLLLEYYRTNEQFTPILRSIGVNQTTKPRLISFYDEVEEQKTPEIIELLKSGKDIALVSDAGTPLISDPGFKLVRECHRQNIQVSPIPGPSSIIAALSVSGLPTDRFLYIGYLPKKKVKRENMFSQLKGLMLNNIVKTVVILETPHHIHETIAEIRSELGTVQITLAHEMTKIHESIVSLAVDTQLSPDWKKGESVLVVSR